MNSHFEDQPPYENLTENDVIKKIDQLNETSSNTVRENPNNSLVLANDALTLSKSHNYEKGFIKALVNAAVCYKVLGRPEEAEPLFSQALERAQISGDLKTTTYIFNQIGLLQKSMGNYTASADNYFKALVTADNIQDHELSDKIMNNLANLYIAWGEFEKAERYHLKLLKIREKDYSQDNLSHTLNNLGNLYFKMKDYDKALDFTQRSLEIKRKKGDKAGIAVSLSTLANINLELFSITDKQNFVELAKNYLTEALKIRKDSQNISGLALTHLDMAKLHLAMKQERGALANLEICEKIASEGNLQSILLLVYQEFSKIYESMGDLPKALKFFKLYQKLNNKIFSEESRAKLLDLQAKYEQTRIEKENEILRLKIEANENLETLVKQRTEELRQEIDRRKISEAETLKFKTLTDRAPYGAAIADSDGKILYVNESLLQMTGFSEEELVGKNLSCFQSPESPLNSSDIISIIEKESSVKTTEILAIRKDKTTFPALINSGIIRDDTGKIIYLQSSVIDITQRKKAEIQLRQNMKMLAIGTMASGIAHDFNNILASIYNFAQIAKNDLPEESPASQEIKNILTTVMKAREFVQEILLMSKDEEKKLKRIKIAEVMRESTELLKKTIPKSIQIKVDIENTDARVLGDPSHVHQILMNLITNSCHAMRERGGVIELNLTNQRDKIRLSVQDTGEGIEKTDLDRIFEPYFTTKGEGSGIGLAIVHGLVEKANGEITVLSEKGEGTTFEILFPILETDSIDNNWAKSISPVQNRNILYVDDEPLFIETMEEILKRLGYKIKTALTSREALEIFYQSPDSFDLIIADFNLPEISGPDMIQKMREVKRDLPVIFCSGFLTSDIKNHITDIDNARVLTKPVPIEELTATIRDSFASTSP